MKPNLASSSSTRLRSAGGSLDRARHVADQPGRNRRRSAIPKSYRRNTCLAAVVGLVTIQKAALAIALSL
jgi:hypothetical protein